MKDPIFEKILQRPTIEVGAKTIYDRLVECAGYIDDADHLLREISKSADPFERPDLIEVRDNLQEAIVVLQGSVIWNLEVNDVEERGE